VALEHALREATHHLQSLGVDVVKYELAHVKAPLFAH
jgi:hypothetical protein